MQTILFEFDSPYGVYRDAIVLTETEYAAMTEADIDQMKQTRFDAWVSAITNPVVQE